MKLHNKYSNCAQIALYSYAYTGCKTRMDNRLYNTCISALDVHAFAIRSRTSTDAIVELDMQSISIVEDDGFRIYGSCLFYKNSATL